MSAVLALANPRRIKASHRRRRKVTVGRFVQRYYDPAIGRFLSVDPMPVNTQSAWNFGRYDYAADNPYRFTDPDGRRISAAEKWEQRRIEKWINARSTTQFKFTNTNRLVVDSTKKDNASGSSLYASRVSEAIGSSKTITVDISATYTSNSGEKGKRTGADAGGGFTQKLPNGDQRVSVSGNGLSGLVSVTNRPLRDTVEDIVMHEFLAHAIPHIVGGGTGNGIDDENKARAQLPGTELRMPEEHDQ